MRRNYMLERYSKLLKWRSYVPLLREALKRALPGAEAYIYGSAVEGKLSAKSDIDVMLVLERVPKSALERARMTARIREELEELGFYDHYLFEFHFVERGEERKWGPKVKVT
ncbi:MAG: nucleotidyltransferase [Crenarchaeota archaeon]|nr:nucleotidyltransferase [Thermoproteota archaeon]